MLRVLSIDDSRAVHAFLTDILSHYELTLEHCFDGKSGVQKVLEQTVPYDLIMLDWEMPIMTGPETLRELKLKKVSSPVIMLTSKNEISDIQGMLEIGASEYVMKPFTPDILLEKIEGVLGTPLVKRANS